MNEKREANGSRESSMGYDNERAATDEDTVGLTLAESEAFNRSLMEGSADCIKVLDLEGRLQHMNGPGMCAMEIEDLGAFVGQHWTQLWPEDSARELLLSLDVARTGKQHSFQAFCPTAKGTPRWWDVAVTPVFNPKDGSVARILAVSRDITELKQICEQLLEADHRKDEFLATLAHELRNPLAPIRNSVHLLKAAGDDPTVVRRVWEMLERQTQQMSRLIDDLMDVSRIAKGRIELQLQTVELTEVLNTAIETSRAQIDAMRQRLDVDFPEGSSGVQADPVRLAQAFTIARRRGPSVSTRTSSNPWTQTNCWTSWRSRTP